MIERTDIDEELLRKVEEFIEEREPVREDYVILIFGQKGLPLIRTLIREDRVSYRTDFKLQTEIQ